MLLIILFLQPILSFAEWDEYFCTSKARSLYNLSQEAEYAKDQFESACNPSYGYQKDDEGACGSYGYVRSDYESAKSNFDIAVSDVEYAASSANRKSRIWSPLVQGVDLPLNRD